MDYISKPALMGKLTSSNMQQKIKAMSGTEAYIEVLKLLNGEPKADVAPVRRGFWLRSIDNDCEMHQCDQCGARVMKGPYEYENPNRYCYYCGARMDGGGHEG